jgi:hypothetical protein
VEGRNRRNSPGPSQDARGSLFGRLLAVPSLSLSHLINLTHTEKYALVVIIGALGLSVGQAQARPPT